ncbi:MAG TPA: nitroreductase/quinone reductase family protein [Acidimicrobiales bacterium]|nr:MAG: nitroreductase [Actinobacteria bacterium 21-73-9]HQU25952.1 nitroreductase/quinone reductase family protein [Acidimicrobiales bacterium]
MRAPPRLKDTGFRALNRFHGAVVRLTGGRLGRRAFGMSVIELRTTGRRSGLERATLLTVPVRDGDTLVVVASKGGDDRDPEWLRNLVALPEVAVTLEGVRRPMRARVADPDEAAELWPRVVARYAPYEGYRRRAARPIPLVVLEPVARES